MDADLATDGSIKQTGQRNDGGGMVTDGNGDEKPGRKPDWLAETTFMSTKYDSNMLLLYNHVLNWKLLQPCPVLYCLKKNYISISYSHV